MKKLISLITFLFLVTFFNLSTMKWSEKENSSCDNAFQVFQSIRNKHITKLFPETNRSHHLPQTTLENLLSEFDPYQSLLLKKEVSDLKENFKSIPENKICAAFSNTTQVFKNALTRKKELIQWFLTQYSLKTLKSPQKIDLQELVSDLKNIESQYDAHKKWLNEWPLTEDDIQKKFLFSIFKNMKEMDYIKDETRRAKVAIRIFIREHEEKEKVITNSDVLLKSLIASLDSHSEFYSEYEFEQMTRSLRSSFVGVGIIVGEDIEGFQLLEIIKGGPTDFEGSLKVGDIITHVNDVAVRGFTDEELREQLSGQEGSSVYIQVLRGENFHLARIQRGAVELNENEFHAEVIRDQFSKTFGYIKLNSFVSDQLGLRGSSQRVFDTLDTFRKNKVEGLVIDLRNNGGGVLSEVVDIAGLFLKSAAIVLEVSTQEKQILSYNDMDGKVYFQKPIVILVNSYSASASEILAGSLKSYHRAIILSEDPQTYGKGTVQRLGDLKSIFGINQNSGLKLTTGFYFFQDGLSPQFEGVKPDFILSDNYNSKNKNLDTTNSNSIKPSLKKQIFEEKVALNSQENNRRNDLNEDENEDENQNEAQPLQKNVKLERDHRLSLSRPSQIKVKQETNFPMWMEDEYFYPLIETLKANYQARQLIPFKSAFTNEKIQKDTSLKESFYVLEDMIEYKNSLYKVSQVKKSSSHRN